MITESDMTYEDMQKAVKSGEKCAKCGGFLTVAWVNGGYVLRCAELSHNTITRHDKIYEQKVRDYRMDSKSLMTMPEAKMLERVNMAKFPQDLTIPEKKLLAQVAITYGLDPLMGEVTIYQGRPFVSIDGRYRKAQETGNLDGVETRPANKQEREDWEIPEGDYFYRTEVYVRGASRPFVAWGRVFKAETIGGKGFKPVEKNPQRMAEKRAEGQALRKAFHIPLPSVEDIGSPEAEAPTVTVIVDQATGEIGTTEQASASGAQSTAPGTKTIQDKIAACKWQPKLLSEWLSDKFGIIKPITPSELWGAIGRLTPEQQAIFTAEVEDRLKLQANS